MTTPPSVPYKELALAVVDADGGSLGLHANRVEQVSVEVIYDSDKPDLLGRIPPRSESPDEIIIRITRPKSYTLTREII